MLAMDRDALRKQMEEWRHFLHTHPETAAEAARMTVGAKKVNANCAP